jgi:DNA-binding MarR family transcriptional regulator
MPEQLMPNNFYTAETYTARGSVGYLLRRAKTLMLDAFEAAIAERGFTFTQYIVLAWLREGIATTAKDICTELSHDSGALARVIDQLAERGLVERTRDIEDRRKVELRLTDLGRQSIEAVIPAVVDVMNWTISDFTHEETVELLRLLMKFNASMEAKLGMSGNCPGVKE